MAKVTIGDRDYVIRELNFIAIEKTWDALMGVLRQPDPIRAVGAALDIFGAALQEEPEFKREDFDIPAEGVFEADELDALVSLFLKRKLKANQIGGVRLALDEVIEEAGLRSAEGELLTTESPGTGTSAPSSPSSSKPDVREETGTE